MSEKDKRRDAHADKEAFINQQQELKNRVAAMSGKDVTATPENHSYGLKGGNISLDPSVAASTPHTPPSGATESTPIESATDATTSTPTTGATNPQVPVETEAEKKARINRELVDYHKSLMEHLYGDEERAEDEKKKKAAKWVSIAQGLADAFGAAANVYWTGKGANHMDIGDGTAKVGAANAALRAEIKARQEKAKDAALAATMKEMDRLYNQANLDRTYEETKKAREMANTQWQKEMDEKKRQFGVTTGQAQQRIAIDQQNANTSEVRAAADSKRINADAQKNDALYGDLPFMVGDEVINVPRELWNNSYQSLYNLLPEDIQENLESRFKTLYGTQSEAVRQTLKPQYMEAAVKQYKDLPEIRNAIAAMAGRDDLQVELPEVEEVVEETQATIAPKEEKSRRERRKEERAAKKAAKNKEDDKPTIGEDGRIKVQL